MSQHLTKVSRFGENLAVINASMLLENAGDAYILPVFAKCNTRPLSSEFIRIHQCLRLP